MASPGLHTALSLLSALALASCSSTLDSFVCETSSQCVNDGETGICEASRVCSFFDPTCANGQRYGNLSGEFSNGCVGSGERDIDGGVQGADAADAADAAEVVCPPSAFITSADDVALYSECVVLESIMLVDTLLDDLTLPNLRAVNGSIQIGGNSALLSVRFEQLQSVGGSVAISENVSLNSMQFGALLVVEGNFAVVVNPQLAVMDAAMLQLVEGAFGVINNDQLGGLNLPSLVAVEGNFVVDLNPSLLSLVLTALQFVDGQLFITNNTMLCLDATVNWDIIAAGSATVSNNATACEI